MYHKVTTHCTLYHVSRIQAEDRFPARNLHCTSLGSLRDWDFCPGEDWEPSFSIRTRYAENMYTMPWYWVNCFQYTRHAVYETASRVLQ